MAFRLLGSPGVVVVETPALVCVKQPGEYQRAGDARDSAYPCGRGGTEEPNESAMPAPATTLLMMAIMVAVVPKKAKPDPAAARAVVPPASGRFQVRSGVPPPDRACGNKPGFELFRPGSACSPTQFRPAL